jgi:FtsP/CotA-like multicopper oxidase with cupredoxin domain
MLSRRALLVSAAAAAVVRPATPRAQTAPAAGSGASTSSTTILQLQRRTIQVNGKPASVFGIRQADGTSGIITKVGKPFLVHLENNIGQPSLVHWHGLTPPWQQDGVPGISAPPIPPGGSADYDFPLRFGGTFWMHSHQGLQEQSLMLAPLIIHDDRDRPGEQEVILMLNDFSFTPPDEIFARLKKSGSMPNMARRPPPMTSATGIAQRGAVAAPDLNDVKYDAFLANDRTLADPEVVKVEPGGHVLLRVINGSSMSNYHLDLGQLTGELIAVDGFRTAPLMATRFPIAVAQRLDIRLTVPREPAAYPVLAVLEGDRRRTGIVLAVGRAAIARIADAASTSSAALTLDFERRLQAAEPLRQRKADRVHTLSLTGDMARYIWSINNVAWNKDLPPLPISKGERVELMMINQTRMPHPMHLHGHAFQVVEVDGERFSGAMRDTVLVPPGRRVVIAFDADNPGLWAFHCHLLYHLDAGMFTTFRYV